jgi:hypothetical protein
MAELIHASLPAIQWRISPSRFDTFCRAAEKTRGRSVSRKNRLFKQPLILDEIYRFEVGY